MIDRRTRSIIAPDGTASSACLTSVTDPLADGCGRELDGRRVSASSLLARSLQGLLGPSPGAGPVMEMLVLGVMSNTGDEPRVPSQRSNGSVCNSGSLHVSQADPQLLHAAAKGHTDGASRTVRPATSCTVSWPSVNES